MPCICYGAISGNEEFDRIIKEEGQGAYYALKMIAAEIKKHKIAAECHREDYLRIWSLAFEHMVHGCPEERAAVIKNKMEE